MEARRHTVTHHQAASFSNVAHEALDHLVVDGDYDEHSTDYPRPLTNQRSRRRLGVSGQILT